MKLRSDYRPPPFGGYGTPGKIVTMRTRETRVHLQKRRPCSCRVLVCLRNAQQEQYASAAISLKGRSACKVRARVRSCCLRQALAQLCHRAVRGRTGLAGSRRCCVCVGTRVLLCSELATPSPRFESPARIPSPAGSAPAQRLRCGLSCAYPLKWRVVACVGAIVSSSGACLLAFTDRIVPRSSMYRTSCSAQTCHHYDARSRLKAVAGRFAPHIAHFDV